MAEISRSVKTKFIAIIILGVTTFAFGAGFFTLLGIEIFEPDPVIPENPTLVNQNILFEGTYNRAYNESAEVLRFEIPWATYYHYREEMNHAIPYPSFIRPNSVRFIAEYIRDNVLYPDEDECVLAGLLSFVQDRNLGGHAPYNASLHYYHDTQLDYHKFPIETIGDGGGDCEDSSLLFMSLAMSLGYDVVVGHAPSHLFAAVKMDEPPTHSRSLYWFYVDGDYYYVCECTGYGWRLGERSSIMPIGGISWEKVPYVPDGTGEQ